MRNRNQSPPTTNTANGGDSEKSQLNWVLQAQNQINKDVGTLLSDSEHASESIKRIEVNQNNILTKIEANQCALLSRLEANQSDLLVKAESNEKGVRSINTKLIVFVAIISTAITVGGAFLNGKVSDVFGSMQEMAESQKKDNEK